MNKYMIAHYSNIFFSKGRDISLPFRVQTESRAQPNLLCSRFRGSSSTGKRALV
jgi:hypothetical protein